MAEFSQVTGWYVWMAKPIISNSGKTAGGLFHFLTPINVKWYRLFGPPQKASFLSQASMAQKARLKKSKFSFPAGGPSCFLTFSFEPLV
jgi:hypothetical protein